MDEAGPTARSRLRRLAPLAALALAAAFVAWRFGDALSFETLERNRDALRAWAEANRAGAAAAFVAIYAAAVAVSAPGAVWLTITGGFVFGLWLGGALSVIGATLGATAIFAAVRAGFGEALRERASGWLSRLAEGFRRNQAEYMLALRLTPVAPFFIVNVAPAFLGVRFRTYVWTTFLGIIPGGMVYASIGAGLDALIARGERPDLGVIFTLPVLGPLLGLAALSLTPALWRALRGRPA
jgi:uncharacterized membrane protein YdjX (TVP38/TMEM64 family)